MPASGPLCGTMGLCPNREELEMAYTQDPIFGPYAQQPLPVMVVDRTGAVTGSVYTKAVALVPGTPVAAGRGVIVSGTGTFGLKLRDGGTVTVKDATNGSGTRFDGFAVVDVDVSAAGTGAAVQILY